MEKKEGRLAFDVNSGKFWILGEGSVPLTSLDFGDTFEVKVDDDWVETSLEIKTGDYGDLVFHMKNTAYYGVLDDLEVRK